MVRNGVRSRVIVIMRMPRPRGYRQRTGVVDTWIRVNDPSAGSPTETLLRLLLPLNDQV